MSPIVQGAGNPSPARRIPTESNFSFQIGKSTKGSGKRLDGEVERSTDPARRQRRRQQAIEDNSIGSKYT